MQSQILLVALVPGKESNVDVEILERGQEEEEMIVMRVVFVLMS